MGYVIRAQAGRLERGVACLRQLALNQEVDPRLGSKRGGTCARTLGQLGDAREPADLFIEVAALEAQARERPGRRQELRPW